MSLPEPKKPTYKIRELAEKWHCSISDIFYYAEEDILQIYKQQNRPDISWFGSEEEQEEAVSKFNNNPIPIDHSEAREIEKKHPSHLDAGAFISLVITDEEKTRFESKYKIGMIEENDQESLDSHPNPQENLPTVLVGPNDRLVWGYEKIGEVVNCHKDNVIKLHKKENLPIYWSAAKPYSTFNRLVSWVENRKGKKRKTAKNFKKK